MKLFFSTFRNKVDKKGRVSVPASFRSVLKVRDSGHDFSGVIVYPSFVKNCLVAGGMSHMESIIESIELMDEYSEERDAFETSIFAGSKEIHFDAEGRILLSKQLAEDTGIEDIAVFVGKGTNFEIWSPESFAKHEEEARKIASEKRGMLGIGRRTKDVH